MKKFFTLFVAVCFSASCFSQGLWSQKATYPSAADNNPNIVTFSIQSSGYLYTGDSANNFFAYDPIGNTWTAMADFPGPAKVGAVGFATDSFGYIGMGQLGSGLNVNTVYQYSPATNTWSAVASYPDSTNVSWLHSFGINTKGYVVGNNSDTAGIRCFSYDRYANAWTRIAPIPYRIYTGFSTTVNSKGYCFNQSEDSIYVYDPVANSWTNQGKLTVNAISCFFVINNKIYILEPNVITGNHAGMKVYDVAAQTWSVINVFPYPAVSCNPLTPVIGLSIDNIGYLGAANSCLGDTYWQYDTAYNFDVTSISPDSVCQNDSFSVTISSNLSFGGSNYFYLQIFSNSYYLSSYYTDSVPGSMSGTYTFKLPSNTGFPGNFQATTVSVFSTNPPNQTGYDSVTFVIKKNPVYLTLPSSYQSCGGSALLLYRANEPGQSYVWTSSPAGVNDSTYELSFTPTVPATTIYTTDINTATGCSLPDSTVVYLNGHPGPNISDSSYGICTGSSAVLGGIASADCSYTWTGPGGFSSSSPDPTITPSVSGTYHVLVKDTLTYCSTGVNIAVTVKQAPAQTICYVTVDSASTHNIVIWEKLDRDATDSFYIYRETATNYYTQIASVPGDSLSEYHDYAANPNVTAYRYKIATLDTCLNSGVLSPYHNTIHLQYLGSGNLIWNVYEIENDTATPVSSFDVYWDTLANGNWAVMLNVPGNQYTATDINFSMHPNAKYRIVANWAYSCTPTRGSNNEVLSNVIQLSPNGISNILSGQSITLYPNPAANELIISAGSSVVQEVSILSAEGRLVSAYYHPVNNKLDVSQLASGIYIAEIKINDTISRIKWVKM